MTPASLDKINRLLLKERFSVYSLWSDAELFRDIVSDLADPFADKKIDKVLAIEARGFILGAAVAYKLGVGINVARKGGKMFRAGHSKDLVLEEELVDYTGEKKILEIECGEAGLQKGEQVLIVDDWFEIGGQGHAAIRLVERAGARVAGVSIMFDDMKDEVRGSFSPYNFHALIKLSEHKKSNWF